MTTPDDSPHLKRVLCSYKSQAMNTLQGPGMNPMLENKKIMDHTSGYHFKKAFINESYNKYNDSSCKKCDIEIVQVPMQSKGSPDANSWHATITPCGEKGQSLSSEKVARTKDETKIILIKKEVPVKKEAHDSAADQTRLRKPIKWVDQPPGSRGFNAPPFPPQPLPVLASADPGVLPLHGRSETYLDGEPIACFFIGGEPRLCLPQILNTVLRNFSLTQINAFCDELQIFCSRCTPRQLDFLKDSGVLPSSATSCGLITKTDAQRLTHALFYSTMNQPAPSHLNPEKQHQIMVTHNCFGKCRGMVWTDLYTSASAACIECYECSNLFTPMQFVCHAHKNLENRTCHWGFDSDNWRQYLMLSKEQNQSQSNAESDLQMFKNKFDSANHKRKQVVDTKENCMKKLRGDELFSSGFDPNYLASYMAWGGAGTYNNTIAPPWTVVPLMTKDGKPLPLPPPVFVKDSIPSLLPEYLRQGPPVLLDPARVVPLSETEKFERNFQPNVALAPLKSRDKNGSLEKVKQEEIRIKSPTKHIMYEKLSDASGEKEVSYVKMEPDIVIETTKFDPPLDPEDELIVVKMDPDSIARSSSRQEGFGPPDLELSTTDSDTESFTSVTSKSDEVEEAEALLRGWTADRPAAEKVLEIVALLAKKSGEKDKKLGEASKEKARLQYTIQLLKKEEARKMNVMGCENAMKVTPPVSEAAFKVKTEP